MKLPPDPQCFVLAQAAAVQSFGTAGSTGASGQNGQAGSPAENVTIFADGTPLTLNLAGRDGDKGRNGDDAKAPDCGQQPEQVTQNLQAADGGNGGNGGNGGDGGNAGSITIYATNVENLRQVFVSAAGGKGGQPGEGGAGSPGCNCSRPYWTVERCFGRPGDPDYRCSTQEFRCRSGRDGLNGNRGLPGRDGLPGKLTLLNLNKPLEADRPTATVTMGTLKDQGFTLSKNQWDTRQGAKALLAPGSVIEDEYLVLTERIERPFLLIWNAPQPFKDFADQNVTLALNDQREVQPTFAGDVWLEGTAQKRGNVTEFVVYNALRSGEATQLGDLVLTGNGQGLKLFLVDKADRSNLVATKFKLKYKVTDEDPRFRPPSVYSTQYSGDIPDNLVVVNGNQITLNIGQLPIPPQYLKPGVGVEVELTAIRSFSNYTAQQELVFQDVLRSSSLTNPPTR
jgi:hypothetical protein